MPYAPVPRIRESRPRLQFDRRLSSSRACRWATLGALVLATAAPPAAGQNQAPPTDTDQQALQHYERAIALHADEAYDAALAELRRAYELRPSYKIIFNMAQVQLAMKDYAAALTSFRHYLDEGGEEVPDKRRTELEAQVATLEQRVATVTLSTDVPGAEVFIDDMSVGRTPDVGPVVVNAGTRKFTLRHPDYDAHTERVSLLGGTSRQLAFSLAHGSMIETPTTPPSTQAGADAPKREHTQEADTTESGQGTPWVPWVVTGVLGAAALGTGLAALSADSELAESRGQADVGRLRLEDKADTVGNLALATDLLLSATVLAGGLSAWLTWGGATDEGSASTSPSLQLLVSPRAASVTGRF